jgi:hypothetical protein
VLVSEIIERWPDPVTATYNIRGAINNLPRWPYQVAAFVAAAGHYPYEHCLRIFRRLNRRVNRIV